MSQQEVIQLRQEIAQLRAELAELKDCSYKHFDLFTAHIADQGTDIADLFSYTMPLLHKAYPGFTAGKRQYDRLLNPPKPDGNPPNQESN